MPIPYKTFDTSVDEVKSYLKEKGVAVIPNVLTKEEVEQCRVELWKMLEDLMADFDKPFKFDDKSSWKSFHELMPLHGMLVQYWSVGQTQFAWNIR